jgi:hypothetical protein
MNKQKLYFTLLTIYVLILIIFSLFNYQNISEWALVEILINYQGGFVRRGLLGEINYLFKDFNNYYYPIVPMIIIGTLYLINFFLIIYLSLKLLRYNPIIFIIILLSPATILFNFYDYGALFRKDVFFITAILVHSLLLNLYFEKKISLCFYDRLLNFLIVPLISINMLIHEAQIFFIFPHILMSLMVYGSLKNKFLKFSIYLLPILIFTIIFFNKGNSEIIEGIKLSLSNYPDEIVNKSYNPIHYLEGNIFLMIGNTLKLFFWYNYNTTIQLLLSFILSFYFFWYLFKAFYKHSHILISKEFIILKKNFFKNLTITFFIVFSSLIFAIDFGRFFHLITMHLIAIILSFPNSFFSKKFIFFQNHNKPLIKIIIFLYFTMWILPHGYIGYAGTSMFQSGFMIINKKIISTLGLKLEKKKIIKNPQFLLNIYQENK